MAIKTVELSEQWQLDYMYNLACQCGINDYEQLWSIMYDELKITHGKYSDFDFKTISDENLQKLQEYLNDMTE